MSEEYDIPVKTRQAVNKHRIASLILHFEEKKAVVIVEEGYKEAIPVGEEGYVDGENKKRFVKTGDLRLKYTNKEDDQETPDVNEQDRQFNKLIREILIDKNLLKANVKANLGL